MGSLLVVGAGQVLDPVDEEVLVLLQDEELTQDDVSLERKWRIADGGLNKCLIE